MILCIGQSAYDITYVIHEDLVENQKYRIYEIMECVGAPATNAASLCAKWQEDSALISRVGNDVYGEKILQTLREQGVDIRYIKELDDFKTPVSTIIAHAETGSRTIFNCPGELHPCEFAYPAHCDVILLDGHEMDASLEALTRFPDAVSVLDAGTCKEETRLLGAMVDHLVCSQDFARQYSGITIDKDNPQTVVDTFMSLRKLNKKQIVVTLGEDGLLYSKDHEILHMPAFNVKAIDTTGAGDIFHGAYAYGVMKKWDMEKILKVASATAALSTEKLGGNVAIPTLEDVEKLTKKE